MAQILGDVTVFLEQKRAQAIFPVPAADPSQRGPTCGFYGLAYVLKYWHERFQLYGGEYQLKKPLLARTHNAKAPEKSEQERQQNKIAKTSSVQKGVFQSLRHFGKYQKLTDYGSVFNAEHLLAVAKGETSQYAGQFDGSCVTVNDVNFAAVVKKLLDWECPVLVPYDVSVDPGSVGEPGKYGGTHAHWVALIGWYKEGFTDRVVYYNWGGFYDASLDAFAVSNGQLTSNEYLKFKKAEVRNPHTKELQSRDYMSKDNILSRQKNGWEVNVKPGKSVRNAEFNDPTHDGEGPGMWDSADNRNRLLVGGLRNRVVAVYRAEDHAEISGALANA